MRSICVQLPGQTLHGIRKKIISFTKLSAADSSSVPDKLLFPPPNVLLGPDQVPHQRHCPLLSPLREAVVIVGRTGAHCLVHHVALLFRNILKIAWGTSIHIQSNPLNGSPGNGSNWLLVQVLGGPDLVFT